MTQRSKTYAEPLAPKIPLSYLIGLVTASAVVMGIVQQAIMNQQMWAILSSIAIAAAIVPILLYIGTFTLANLFSTIGAAAAGEDAPQRVHVPTTRMPDKQGQ